MKVEISKEELEQIVTALSFSSCVDSMWDNELEDLKKFATLAVNLCKKYNVKPSKCLLLYNGVKENPDISDILKNILDEE